MRKNWLSTLVLLSIFSAQSCDSDAFCSCGESCTADAGISCSLDAKELEKRKRAFQSLFFDKAIQFEEVDTGFRFLFKDEGKLNERLFKFVLEEKKCCPFFQYDIKVLPYSEGIDLTISGEGEVQEFLTELFAEFDVKK